MARPPRAGLRAVSLLDHRDDVLPELFFEERKRQLRMLRIAAVHHLVVRHRDDHRQRLAFRNQVVGDEPRAAVDVPRRRQLTAAAEQVQHRILSVPVVVGRRVDVHLALPVQDSRVVDVSSDVAMRDGLRVVVGRPVAVDDDRAVTRLIGKSGQRVVRIHHRHAVHDETIDVEIRLQWADRQRPDAIAALLEWNRRVALADRQEDRTTAQRHRSRVGRPQTERDRAVVTHFGRNQVRAEGSQVLEVLVRIPIQVHVGLLGPRRL